MTRTALVTGATSGLGLHATRRLLDGGWDVVAVGRNVAALPDHPRLRPMAADLSRLAAVDTLVEGVRELGLPPVRAVLANAGGQFSSPTTTADGFEATLALNVLSPLRLVDRLAADLPAGARIVLTTSGTHDPDLVRFMPHARADATIEELARPTNTPRRPRIDGFRRYATSKLALVRCLPRLAQVLAPRGVAVLGFDPGLMPDTALARHYGPRFNRVYGALAPALLAMPGAHLSRTSAAHLVELATAPRWEGVSGAHIIDRRTSGTSRASYDIAAGDRWYADLVGLAGADGLTPAGA